MASESAAAIAVKQATGLACELAAAPISFIPETLAVNGIRAVMGQNA